jgi:hypothetical protein
MAFIGFGFLGIAWVGGIGALSLWFYLLTRRRWDAPALTVGVLHMLRWWIFTRASVLGY